MSIALRSRPERGARSRRSAEARQPSHCPQAWAAGSPNASSSTCARQPGAWA